LSADTLVPSPANPQTLNRFSYVLGNPCRYNDPTGHSCADPQDETEAWGCYYAEQEILESTVLLKAEWEITTCRNGKCTTTIMVGWSHATILDDHTLITHNHFEPKFWDEEDFWNRATANFTAYRADGQEITGINYQDSQTYADGPETRALIFGPNSFSSPASFAEPGDKLPKTGSEVAVVTWKGSPGSTAVQWAPMTGIGGRVEFGDGTRVENALTVDITVRKGASGGGIFSNGTHIANNYAIGKANGQGVTVGALNPQLR
jgi:hypothetical protein